MSLAPWRMIPRHSWVTPGRNPGTSTKVRIGMLNASQVLTNRAAFSPAEADHDVRREAGVYLQELAVVEHVGDHLVHVVGLVRRVGDERVEFRGVLIWFGVVVGGGPRGPG